MKIIVQHRNKNGKIAVAICFDHGVTLRKIVTPERLLALQQKERAQLEREHLHRQGAIYFNG